MNEARDARGGRTVGWAVAGVPLEAGDESGDLHVVAEFPDGALVGAIDGLGHGSEAAVAARAAAAVLERSASLPLVDAIQRCHEALRGTRGAVLSLASLHAPSGTMSWVGVGNVDAVLVRDQPAGERMRAAIPTRGGVVGYQLPPLHTGSSSLQPGDILVFATDGVRSTFSDAIRIEDDLQAMADRILAQHVKGNDDALVLVVRYLGGGG